MPYYVFPPLSEFSLSLVSCFSQARVMPGMCFNKFSMLYVCPQMPGTADNQSAYPGEAGRQDDIWQGCTFLVCGGAFVIGYWLLNNITWSNTWWLFVCDVSILA